MAELPMPKDYEGSVCENKTMERTDSYWKNKRDLSKIY